MGVLQHVVAPAGVAAGNGYSQVVTGRGRLVAVSGQIAQDERGELVGPGDPAAQARQVVRQRDQCFSGTYSGGTVPPSPNRNASHCSFSTSCARFCVRSRRYSFTIFLLCSIHIDQAWADTES